MLLNAKLLYIISKGKTFRREYRAICREIYKASKEGKVSIIHRGELTPAIKDRLKRKNYKVIENKSTYIYEIYWGRN